MKQIRKVGIIRQRGQFTIPDAIRDAAVWLKENGAVVITLVTPTRLEIEPLKEGNGKVVQETTDWETIWKRMEEVRKLPGKYKGSLSEFIISDRQTRR
ncbi:hypothetical protein A3H16_02720 [Candidatus Kaiserbacteria bacterium RIFCSPLOWO2_12_FULL_53_8]|uniref:Uncharacterized protein n=1 Tax=Candidatus Kaiserbacteria bacterium RIFCSPLOWO2_12_FULL_53_8 TaxID=1798529 RepID=A0A1F6G1A6_9BACT|nr:MAG: hypothetical protein A3H16_02720 [Candidatus Kaiserbacteria bacterium RIFCSPLOWO2_12_FULL_53_8]